MEVMRLWKVILFIYHEHSFSLSLSDEAFETIVSSFLVHHIIFTIFLGTYVIFYFSSHLPSPIQTCTHNFKLQFQEYDHKTCSGPEQQQKNHKLRFSLMAELINTSHISIMVKCYFASASGFCDYYNSRIETEKSECFRVSNSSSVIGRYVYEMRYFKLWRNFYM